MTQRHTGLPAFDTLAFAQERMAAGMPEDAAKVLVHTYRDISSRDPFTHDSAGIRARLSATGVTPAVVRVMTRPFRKTGALLAQAGVAAP